MIALLYYAEAFYFIIILVNFCSCFLSEKSLFSQMSWNVSTASSSSSFSVSGLISRSLVHFWDGFYVEWELGDTFQSSAFGYWVLLPAFVEDAVHFATCFWLLYWELSQLIVDVWFYFWDIYFAPLTVYMFWLPWLCGMSSNHVLWCLLLCSFGLRLLWLFSPLCYYINFRSFFSFSLRCHW